jgi:hypothetical protein
MNERTAVTHDQTASRHGERPARVRLTRRDEIEGVALALVDTARRTVRCMHRDASGFGLSRAAMVERLQRFLSSHPGARLRLLVDDSAWLERDAPRLKLLQQHYTHAIEVRMANQEDPVGDDAALLIDDAHSLVLAQTAQGIGDVWFGNAPRAQPLVASFERRWHSAAYNLAVHPLGL